MQESTASSFEPNDPATIDDPFPVYKALRDQDPVHWNPKGFWFISRYEDVLACLKDARFSNQPAPFALVHARNRSKFVAADVANNLIAFKDAPDHTELRAWLARNFVRRTQNQQDRFAALAAASCKTLSLGGNVDLVSEFAIPFSSRAICAVLGFPEADAPRVAEWSNDFFRLFHAIPDGDEFHRLNDSLRAFRQHVLDLMALRRAAPIEDLISDLVSKMDGSVSDHEVADNVMLLAADGIGNVQSGLTNCLSILLQQDRLPEPLFGSTKDVSKLVDECLRLESPGQYQGRITKESVQIRGKTIRARSIVLLGLASANRDEAVFENADAFRPLDTRPQHLAFGAGSHMCLGNAMVRTEIVHALRALFAEDAPRLVAQPHRHWLARPGHRWLEKLDVEVLA
ncbi:cytochrome P450 [Dinoroseobacter sp. S76]|uniref:cytochrome P450 n=1 Tax=Dinoroseobacter sp. S76 TaxID=3415124 RepID=UPI003C7CF834